MATNVAEAGSGKGHVQTVKTTRPAYVFGFTCHLRADAEPAPTEIHPARAS